MKSNFKKLLFLRKLDLHQPPGYLQESALTVPVATHDVGLLLCFSDFMPPTAFGLSPI